MIQRNDKVAAVHLRIELMYVKPAIWRQVSVPDDLSLGDLHTVIQIAMGWQNCHLHMFEHQGERIGEPDEESPEMTDEEDIFVSDVFTKKGSKLRYEYDFGDGWEHIITCQGRQYSEESEVSILDGRRACPPEDCGGIPGYANLLKCLSDSTHPEHEDMLEWIGEEFDPDLFDVEEANAILYEVQDSMGWQDGGFDEDLSDPFDDEFEGELEYDALEAPDPQDWLAMDEGERVYHIEQYHKQLDVDLPNTMLHASMHVVVENQLAENLLVTHRTLQRLMDEGLDRHEAIHAISTAVAGQMQDLMTKGKAVDKDTVDAQYYERLKKLTAQAWRDMA
jgi:hypothetical protein